MSGKCECVPCAMCDGTGEVWRGISGKYLGGHHMDDLDSSEMCEECGGRGVESTCDYCLDQYGEGGDQ